MDVTTCNYAFISYAHADEGTALPIIERLSLDHIVWYDEGIPSSEQYDDAIAHKIENCSCFIALLTKNYDASKYCRSEIIFADSQGIPILPVYLEPSVKSAYIPGSTIAKTPKCPTFVPVVDALADRALVIGDFHGGERATVECKIRAPEIKGKFYPKSSIATQNGTVFCTAIINVR